MRTIGVVTVARSDYSIYLPVLRRIQEERDLQLRLIIAGMHLSPEFGLTASQIEEDGFQITDRVEMLLSSDTPEGIGKSMGLGTIGFAQTYARCRPDILLVLGDRFEMHAAVVASLPFKMPVAHIHGGESTEGLIDESIRHSITKMSHLHFASTEKYAERLIQMGEEPWRVTVSGAPSLDNLSQMPLLNLEELKNQYGLDLSSPFLLVTCHPVTLEYEQTQYHMSELLSALEESGYGVVFTYPNADTCGRLIIEMITESISRNRGWQVAVNLGTQGYVSLMSHAAAMVGNSSSGIIEAASSSLPVVNIGNRQRGRLHGPNVIDVGYRREEVRAGIARAGSPQFRSDIAGIDNPYGDGHAAQRIVQKLREIRIDDKLLMKRFFDIEMSTDAYSLCRDG